MTWTIDAIPPGEERLLELSATLHSPGANLLRVVAAAAGDLADASTAMTNVEAVADLKLEVGDPPGPIAVGEEVVYEVHIRNRGTKAATDVEAAAFFSEGIEPVQGRRHGPRRQRPGGLRSHSLGWRRQRDRVEDLRRATRQGNHVFRAEVRCKAAGAHLVTEESTLFYQPTGHSRRPSGRALCRMRPRWMQEPVRCRRDVRSRQGREARGTAAAP